MSFFKKALASIGIGGVKVDTILENSSLVVGEDVRGRVEITGGNIHQDIDAIHLTLYSYYVEEINDKKVTNKAVQNRIKLTDAISIRAGEKQTIPFTLHVPLTTPLTFGRKLVWVHTSLDVKNAIDPTDNDYMEVSPNELMDEIFSSVQNLGFRLRQVEVERAPSFLRNRTLFVQEFEFVPTSGEFARKLDELEVIILPNSSSSVEVILEVDRKARGLMGSFLEALDMDESIVRLTISESDRGQVEQMLRNVIRKYI
ncbi:sporulation protein [Priestia taiwanensis]|uniref:Sporulation-control protein n=1 Tax=Priestia taiwanensis TaxID=1347902 RepID=A0A917AM31_9BACI|nr:sporulation protein [Priestia taiwanensis]MBM7362160.1 sporulation-control protein [Priestia taiwanensis]GGE59889.1 sporulation-control protein [Priestia taiwanensis]